MRVYVLVILEDATPTIRVCESMAQAQEEMLDWVRMWWNTAFEGHCPDELTEDDIDAYWESVADLGESYVIESTMLIGTPQ